MDGMRCNGQGASVAVSGSTIIVGADNATDASGTLDAAGAAYVFDRGDDVTPELDLERARRPNLETKRVNVDFPLWMVESLDAEATRLGVTRQSVIKMWLAERLDEAGYSRAKR